MPSKNKVTIMHANILSCVTLNNLHMENFPILYNIEQSKNKRVFPLTHKNKII